MKVLPGPPESCKIKVDSVSLIEPLALVSVAALAGAFSIAVMASFPPFRVLSSSKRIPASGKVSSAYRSRL